MIKAIDRFDVDRGVELTTYATPNIIGEIKRHFRDKGWSVRVPRGLQELNVKLSKLIEEQTIELGRSPTIPELAKVAGVEEELVVEAIESGRAYSTVSLSTGGGQDDEGELDPLESLGSEEPQYEVSEDRAMLAPGFQALDERERLIIHLRFFKGLTQSQIAQQVGISQMHVSRLIRRALERIREEIGDDGWRGAGAEEARRRLSGAFWVRRRPPPPRCDRNLESRTRVRRECAKGDSYNHSHAHERRAAGGLPLVLRVEGPQAAPIRLARPA